MRLTIPRTPRSIVADRAAVLTPFRQRRGTPSKPQLVGLPVLKDRGAGFGRTWLRGNLATGLSWNSVAFGNGTYVAIATDAGGGLATSPDGLAWTSRAVPGSQRWDGVTFGNGRFVMVSATGSPQTAWSTDGVTWNLVAASSVRSWGFVAFGANRFVAGNASGNHVMYSTDGTSWTDASTLVVGSNYGGGMAFGNGIFVGTGQGATGFVDTSPDGNVWTQRSTPANIFYRNSAFGNGIWVIPGGTQAAVRSIDNCVTLDLVTMPLARGYTPIVFARGIFITAHGGSSGDAIALSSNGLDWQTASHGFPQTGGDSIATLASGCVGSNGVVFVAGSGSGTRSILSRF